MYSCATLCIINGKNKTIIQTKMIHSANLCTALTVHALFLLYFCSVTVIEPVINRTTDIAKFVMHVVLGKTI